MVLTAEQIASLPPLSPKETTPPEVLDGLCAAITSDDKVGFVKLLASYVGSERCTNFHELDTVLKHAINEDKPFFVTQLLQNGMKVHFLSAVAAINAKAKTSIEAFLESGWDINENISETDPSVISELLPNALDRKTDVLQVVSLLLDKGAPVNALDYENHPTSRNQFFFMDLGTPLHKAAANGMLDAVQLLLDHGADVNIKSSKGRTAKDLAEKNGYADVVRVLVSQKDKI